MKRLLLRLTVVLVAVLTVLASLPAGADFYLPGPDAYEYTPIPWWEISPPKTHTRTRTRTVTRTPETIVETISAEGYCYTAIKRVNVRSQPSIYSTRVQTIRSSGTEFTVTARAKNSSGEIWYAVQLANGTLGYIRSDLLNTDHVILHDDPYAYEEGGDTRAVPASESASDTLNVTRGAGQQDPGPTPQIIYVTPAPGEAPPTPTPIIVYVTPDPEITPQVIYINQE